MLACLGLWPGLPAIAQWPFARQPEPQRPARIAPSMARNEQDYRKDAARHLYAMYPAQVLKGMVRANVYAIMVTETTVDANGKVLSVHVLRKPAVAHEVTPWVVALIRKASPLPPLLHLKRARYVETWLVDQSGQFQVRTLTEGQL
jgi:hypothetical protein